MSHGLSVCDVYSTEATLQIVVDRNGLSRRVAELLTCKPGYRYQKEFMAVYEPQSGPNEALSCDQ